MTGGEFLGTISRRVRSSTNFAREGHELIKGKVCFKYSLILKHFFEI